MICASLAVGLHLATYHFKRDAEYQEFNPGVYVTCDSVTGGVYQNSENRVSAYAAYNFQHGPFTLSVGGVAGYRKYAVAPLVVPSVTYKMLRVSLIPPLEKASGGVHFSLETKI